MFSESFTQLLFQGQWLLGHPGLGGQNVKIDVSNHLAFAYLCNGLKTGLGDYTVTFIRLQNALYECLRESNLLKESAVEKTEELAESTRGCYFLVFNIYFI